MNRGKNYRESDAKREKSDAYTIAAAVELVKTMTTAKFDETVEVSARLGVNPRHADQMVRGTVVLPNGTGRTVRVLALVKGEHAEAAKAAGADMVRAD
jgi:large subunit ribosomal protein L1